MIEDKDTNIVYLSKWLKKEHEGFYNRLTSMFDSLGIRYEILKYTNDFWCRDYMPIQLEEDVFIKYRYYPDYLLTAKEDKNTITNSSRTCKCIGIKYKETDIILDGGNITACGDYFVLTDKVFIENKREKGDAEFINQLKDVLHHKIIIIPWHCINPDDKYADVYGHSDGFIHWCGGNKVLMSNHRSIDSIEAEVIKQAIESKGFEVFEMLFDVEKPNPDYNWAYINYLQIGKIIIMPKFEIEEDDIALNFVKQANSKCKVYQIEMKEIANEGGALHCITWNIKKIKSQHL